MASRLCSRVSRVCAEKAKHSHHAIKRSFCYSKSSDVCDIPLSEPLPNMPPVRYAAPSNHMNDTHVTTLENGLTVASENKFGQFCTVGVLTDSGSRYEVAHPSGISHFLEKLAFTSTAKYSDRDAILQELEIHGGICDCQSSRDTLIHAISADIKGLPNVVDILSEVVLRPTLSEAEMDDTRMAVQFELESLNMRPDPEPLLMEMIHTAAYRGNTLGLPKICPAQNVMAISRNDILSYMSAHHTPNRMVLAGVGMPHEQLVEVAKEYFVTKTPTWVKEKDSIDTSKGPCQSLAQYTGGECKVEKDLSSVSLGPTPMPELAHIVIGLESCSHKDPDFVACCVLNMLMGGGGSFSAGGPGKGMYTRLYLNVLNRHHWMFNATAYNHSYNDSGVFCIHASAHPTQLRDVVEVIVKEMVNMAGRISPDELDRAKKQLQSMLMMNLESRPVVFEDVGRQVLANEHRQSAKYFFDKIGEITASDLQSVANRLLRTKVSVAALGDLSRLPDYEQIQNALISRDRFFSKRFSLFR